MPVRYDIFPVTIDAPGTAEKIMQEMGVCPGGISIMAPKGKFFTLKVGPLKHQAANILKQEMLTKGGEAAVKGSVICGADSTYALLMGTLAQFKKLIPKLKQQPFGLKELGEELETALEYLMGNRVRKISCRGKELVLGRKTLVMGILNVTPDSFSDGGLYNNPDAALERALEMEEQGADIIDVGAESTRPGFEPVSEEEEISRLMPVLEKLVDKVKVPISVDTYKSRVARLALERGTHIINDVSGLADPHMAETVAKYGAPIIIMHGVPENTESILEGVIRTLRKKRELAEEKGVKRENIILDPGIGFAKNTRQNLEVINGLDVLKVLGQPILLGVSRKSVIGNVLKLPPEERLEGTAAAVTVGILRGADIVRVHDVKEMVRVVRMTDALLGKGEAHGW
ncbi:MAG: dihydropteroate synthase [Clostridia bacterium]|nr:dihydropteroate synthase [Clostridia bacterium]